MTVPFPSDVWVKAMMVDLNESAAYLDAAKNWEGSFDFIVTLPDGKVTTLYMDLMHGKCLDAYEVPAGAEGHTAAFRLSGPVATWKKVMTKKLDPMQAMMTGQLKLAGNMAMVMKNVRAAKELVESCTRIPTDFPV